MVFHEIMPQALSLMTDVFGNYVVQKVLFYINICLNWLVYNCIKQIRSWNDMIDD